MKLFVLIAKDPGWDEFEKFAILAENEVDAWNEFDNKYEHKYCNETNHNNWNINEIDMTKKGIILSAFHGG